MLQPPSVPTSRNYAEMRDKLRQRLKRKVIWFPPLFSLVEICHALPLKQYEVKYLLFNSTFFITAETLLQSF